MKQDIKDVKQELHVALGKLASKSAESRAKAPSYLVSVRKKVKKYAGTAMEKVMDEVIKEGIKEIFTKPKLSTIMWLGGAIGGFCTAAYRWLRAPAQAIQQQVNNPPAAPAAQPAAPLNYIPLAYMIQGANAMDVRSSKWHRSFHRGYKKALRQNYLIKRRQRNYLLGYKRKNHTRARRALIGMGSSLIPYVGAVYGGARLLKRHLNYRINHFPNNPFMRLN